jgi:hypothetical protein
MILTGADAPHRNPCRNDASYRSANGDVFDVVAFTLQ